MVKKKKSKSSKEKSSKNSKYKPETLKIQSERDIAMDFATKIYHKFDKVIKCIILFGSSVKKTATSDSDIDIIVVIDDVAIKWDEEMIAWYREELGKIVTANPYKKSLHVNTVKLSTWWDDLRRGDPIIMNIIRYGDSLIDFGGFFAPLKVLLEQGKIRPTPESVYVLLKRTPQHIARARTGLMTALDGIYWAFVDSAHAALIAANEMPSSPENIPQALEETFVSKKKLKQSYVNDYSEVHQITKDLVHGKQVDLTGEYIDELFEKVNDFVQQMADIVEELTSKKN